MNQVHLDASAPIQAPTLDCKTRPLPRGCSLSESDKLAAQVNTATFPEEVFAGLSLDQRKDVFPKLSEDTQGKILHFSNKNISLKEKAGFFSVSSHHSCKKVFGSYNLENQKKLTKWNSQLKSFYNENVAEFLKKKSGAVSDAKRADLFEALPVELQLEIVNDVDIQVLVLVIFNNRREIVGSKSKQQDGELLYKPTEHTYSLLGKMSLERQLQLISKANLNEADKRILLQSHALKLNAQVDLLKTLIIKDFDPGQYTRILGYQMFSFQLNPQTLARFQELPTDGKKLLLNSILTHSDLLNSLDILIALIQAVNLEDKIALIDSLTKHDQLDVLAKLNLKDFKDILEAQLNLPETPSTAEIKTHDEKVLFYKDYFLRSSNRERYNQLFFQVSGKALLIFNSDPVGIRLSTELSAESAAKASRKLNFSPEANLKLFNSFSNPTDKHTFFMSLGDKNKKLNDQNFQLFAQLTSQERNELKISAKQKGLCYQAVNDQNEIILQITQAEADEAQAIFKHLGDRQKPVYRSLDLDTRRKLNLDLEALKSLTLDYSFHEKVAVLKMLNPTAFAEYYQELNVTERVEVYKLLEANDQKKLAHLFPERTLAYQVANGNSPFMIEGANSFVNRVYQKDTRKDFSLLLKMSSESPQLKAYNQEGVCNDEQRFAGNCASLELSGVDIQCSEQKETGLATRYANLQQFEKGEPSHCDVTLKSPSGQAAQYPFDFPADKDRFNEFARYNLPTLVEGKVHSTFEDLALASLRKTASSTGNAMSVDFTASVGQFKNLGYGIFDPQHTIDNFFGKRIIKAPAAGAGTDLVYNSKVEIDLSKAIAKDKKLELECKEDVSGLKGQSTSCTYVVMDVAGNIFQSLSHKQPATARVEIEANNPFILSSWQNFAKKIGIPQTLDEGTLFLGEAAPASGDSSNDSSEGIGILPRLKANAARAAELAVMNLLPAAAGAYLAYLGGKRIQVAVNHSRKTVGQKAAGATLGVAGILAGVAIAYNRLSSIQLTLS